MNPTTERSFGTSCAASGRWIITVTQLHAEIIIALADNQLKITEAAKKLFMHRTTLNYHIQKIHKTTGKNPLDFYDMCELLHTARQVINGEVTISAQTRNALLSHGERR